MKRILDTIHEGVVNCRITIPSLFMMTVRTSLSRSVLKMMGGNSLSLASALI